MLNEATLTLVIEIILTVMGVLMFLQPQRFQRSALYWYDKRPSLARFNPFLSWMRTQDYMRMLRVFGIVAMVFGLLLVMLSGYIKD